MITALVGHTGFVGSNLLTQYHFTHTFNSGNIDKAYNLQPDILIYAGVRAEKFLANEHATQDLHSIIQAFQNIDRIHPRKLVLISTIDVYHNTNQVDEDSTIEYQKLSPYGANRYILEQMVRQAYPGALIVRLPALFGRNIKKNFIYDFLHKIPSKLNAKKYCEVTLLEPHIKQYYELSANGFYNCKKLNESEKNHLSNMFTLIGFTALNFTDSRGIFQFYDLSNLWNHIKIALNKDLKLLNIAVEPVQIAELYYQLTGSRFINEICISPPFYDFKTKYSNYFDGKNGYIYPKETVINAISNFIEREKL